MKKALILAIFIANNILSQSVFSQEFALMEDQACTTIRLDKSDSLNKVPHYSQGGSQLCAAYAASTLIDEWRIRNNKFDGKLTSPVSLFYQYQKYTGDYKNSDVAILGLLRSLPKYASSCSTPLVTFLDTQSTKPPTGVNALGQCQYEAHKSAAATGDDESILFQRCVTKIPTHGTAFGRLAEKYYPQKITDGKDWSKFLSAVTADLCENNSSSLSFMPNISSTGVEGRVSSSHAPRMHRMRSHVNSGLSKGVPVGISYCHNVLDDRGSKGVSLDGKPSGVCDSHVSLVVGRRLLKYRSDGKDETICQYMVRDSYGRSCAKYPPDLNTSPTEQCEDGNVWIDENALFINTMEAVGFASQ